jgi:hypothetical protein
LQAGDIILGAYYLDSRFYRMRNLSLYAFGLAETSGHIRRQLVTLGREGHNSNIFLALAKLLF